MPDPTTPDTTVTDVSGQPPTTPEQNQALKNYQALQQKLAAWHMAGDPVIGPDGKIYTDGREGTPYNPITQQADGSLLTAGHDLPALKPQGSTTPVLRVVRTGTGAAQTSTLVSFDPSTNTTTPLGQVAGNPDLVEAQLRKENSDAHLADVQANNASSPEERKTAQAEAELSAQNLETIRSQTSKDVANIGAAGSATVANINAASSASNTAANNQTTLANTGLQGANTLQNTALTGQNRLNEIDAQRKSDVEKEIDLVHSGVKLPEAAAKEIDAINARALAALQGEQARQTQENLTTLNKPKTDSDIALQSAQAQALTQNAATSAATEQDTALTNYTKPLIDQTNNLQSQAMEMAKNGYAVPLAYDQAAFSPMNAAYAALANGLTRGSVNPAYIPPNVAQPVPNAPAATASTSPPAPQVPVNTGAPSQGALSTGTPQPSQATPSPSDPGAADANTPETPPPNTATTPSRPVPTRAPVPTAPAAPVNTAAPRPRGAIIGPAIGRAAAPGNSQPGIATSGTDAAQRGTGAPTPTAQPSTDTSDPTNAYHVNGGYDRDGNWFQIDPNGPDYNPGPYGSGPSQAEIDRRREHGQPIVGIGGGG